jgi:ribosomal protein S27AE
LRVSRALAKGVLKKQNCQHCGRADSQAHHEDYSKPLDVMWLCSTCHGALHAKQRRGIAA